MPRGSTYQNLLSFQGCIRFHCTYVSYFVYPFDRQWALLMLHTLACEPCYCDQGCTNALGGPAVSSLGCVPQSRIAGSQAILCVVWRSPSLFPQQLHCHTGRPGECHLFCLRGQEGTFLLESVPSSHLQQALTSLVQSVGAKVVMLLRRLLATSRDILFFFFNFVYVDHFKHL